MSKQETQFEVHMKINGVRFIGVVGINYLKREFIGTRMPHETEVYQKVEGYSSESQVPVLRCGAWEKLVTSGN